MAPDYDYRTDLGPGIWHQPWNHESQEGYDIDISGGYRFDKRNKERAKRNGNGRASYGRNCGGYQQRR